MKRRTAFIENLKLRLIIAFLLASFISFFSPCTVIMLSSYGKEIVISRNKAKDSGFSKEVLVIQESSSTVLSSYLTGSFFMGNGRRFSSSQVRYKLPIGKIQKNNSSALFYSFYREGIGIIFKRIFYKHSDGDEEIPA